MMDQLMLLLGTWEGEGIAIYPTIDEQAYSERLTFTLDEPHAAIQFEQKTWRKPSGRLLHWEFGFFRLLDDGSLHFSCVANSGRVEVMTGQLTPLDAGFRLSWTTSLFGSDERMLKATREWIVDGDRLTYEQSMATTSVPDMQTHLRASLRHHDG